jgi:hypothetical protein
MGRRPFGILFLNAASVRFSGVHALFYGLNAGPGVAEKRLLACLPSNSHVF